MDSMKIFAALGLSVAVVSYLGLIFAVARSPDPEPITFLDALIRALSICAPVAYLGCVWTVFYFMGADGFHDTKWHNVQLAFFISHPASLIYLLVRSFITNNLQGGR